MKGFKNILDFLEAFKDDETCLKAFEDIRFRNGAYCPHCSCKTVYKYANGKLWKCADCRKQFTVKVGTIFEGSKISMKKWFLAIYYLTQHSKGISSIQLAKDVGVTQKTAWFMAHRIRECLQHESGLLFGQVEIDETYVGGKEKNKHSNKRQANSQGGNNKEVVFGAIERGENKRVKAIHLENNKPRHIQETIIKNIKTGSELLTDESNAYMGIDSIYSRYSCNHSQKKYVVDEIVYNNNVENFWSIFKRGYIGVYHWMSKKHLQRYLNEYTFRYNNRSGNNLNNTLSLSIEKRMTYKQLISKKVF